ncbi:MAG: MFS transporter [Bacteroidales bacterium]|nr:MFS transporter [Bacteroidales bacterium]
MAGIKKFQTGNVLLISISHLLHDIYSSFLAPILPLLIEKLSLSYSMVGLLTVIQRIPSLLNPFIGLLADKMPVRYLVIVTPAITAIVASLFGLAPSFTVLAILLFVMGLSAALFHVPAPVMIKKISGNRTGKGMSFYMLGGEIARTVGPLIILGAVTIWGLEGTYKLIPFGLLASVILYFRLRKIKISEDMRSNKMDVGIRKTISNLIPFFVVLSGIVFFRAFLKSALSTFLPTYITVQGESLWAGGIALAILQFAGAIGTLFSGSISDRIGRKSTLIIISIASPVFMWLFTISTGVFTIPLLILLGFFLFASGPVLLALVQDRSTERPSLINGIFLTISFTASSITIMLVGLLGDKFGLELTFRIAALIALAAIPFTLMLKE